MMRATVTIRFINRQINRDTYRILQQKWVGDGDPFDAGAIRYEWRDVPTVDDEDGNP